MNILDIILIAVIAGLTAAAIVVIVIRKRRGRGCSCGCENCGYPCQKRSADPHNVLSDKQR